MTDEIHSIANDEVRLFGGRSLRLPGGIYTFVFIILAVLTIIEIVLSDLPEGALRVIILFAIAIAKAALVVIYYMHLKSDRRVFAWVLLISLAFAIFGGFFLLLSPEPYAFLR